MKKLIAGAALVATLMGTTSAAFADNHTITTTQVGTTVQTGTTTTAPTTTTTPAPTTTTTTAPEATTTATTTTTTSTEAQLPNVTLTPDKLFYALKIWVEKIQLAVTVDAAAKASLLEQQAQTRLAEAKAMAEAGKVDLATTAMAEAKAKLAAAQTAITAAASTNKDLTALTAQIEADQVKFATTLTNLLAKAPEGVQTQFEPVVTDLLVQLAATLDAASQDDEAEKAAEAIKSETKKDISKIQPRTLLVLKAMAKASGKSLDEVLALYAKNPGLGNIAKQLGLKMGPVQHAAQIEWKVEKKGGAKVEVKVEAETEDEDEDEDEAKATITLPGVTLGGKTGLKVEVKKENGKENGKGHDKSKDDKGKGKN